MLLRLYRCEGCVTDELDMVRVMVRIFEGPVRKSWIDSNWEHLDTTHFRIPSNEFSSVTVKLSQQGEIK